MPMTTRQTISSVRLNFGESIDGGDFGINRFESMELAEVDDGDFLASHDDENDEVAAYGECVVAPHDDDDELDGHGCDVSHDDRVESDDDEGVEGMASNDDEVVHGNDHLYAHDDAAVEGGAYGVYGDVAAADGGDCGVSRDDVVEESLSLIHI